ncbi:hypothetical protein GIB67_000597 [Kingdonia uniflora]|uniref:DUF8040 domain-containing protein n=1 Tax=Kingdonia uniflora TaxID=39325 RepID=A0A7J7P765_9MAGN|nr:hypothetical protein GIB67_000597 [Kingdonia uniflora]
MNQVQWLLGILAIIILYNEVVKQNRRVRQRLYTSALTGKAYVQELLEGPKTVMYNMMRLDPASFRSLVAHFKDTGLLRDSKHIDVEKKLAILLHIIVHNMRNGAVNIIFQPSAATTSKVFHECLDAMIKFSKEMIVPTNFDEPRNIMVACIIIYNYLRRAFLNDELFKQFRSDDVGVEGNEEEVHVEELPPNAILFGQVEHAATITQRDMLVAQLTLNNVNASIVE